MDHGLWTIESRAFFSCLRVVSMIGCGDDGLGRKYCPEAIFIKEGMVNWL